MAPVKVLRDFNPTGASLTQDGVGLEGYGRYDREWRCEGCGFSTSVKAGEEVQWEADRALFEQGVNNYYAFINN